jgi:hypothetical protein
MIYETHPSEDSLRVIKIIKIIVKAILAAMMYACWSGLLNEYFKIMILASFVGFLWVTYREFKEGNFITGVFTGAGMILLNPVYVIDLNIAQYALYLALAIGCAISIIVDLLRRPPKEEFGF